MTASQPLSGTFPLNGASLFYEAIGAGPTIVLISGGGLLDHRLWNPQTAGFADGHRVVRYDIRGIGRSTRPDAPFSHSDDLAQLLAALQAAPADIVGLSFGAAIAIDAALDHPELVRRLVLASPGLSSDKAANLQGALTLSAMARDDGVSAVIDRLITSPELMPHASVDSQQLVRSIYADNADIFTADFPLIRFWQPTRPAAVDRLWSIRVPTLIVTGDRDGAAARHTAATIHDAIAGSSLEIVTGAGHLVNLDGSGAFDRVVLSFLER